jgi:hypothetical protein
MRRTFFFFFLFLLFQGVLTLVSTGCVGKHPGIVTVEAGLLVPPAQQQVAALIGRTGASSMHAVCSRRAMHVQARKQQLNVLLLL